MEELDVIYNTCKVINNKLNIVLPKSDNIYEYNNYLDIVLNIVKKPKLIPRSWIDEKEDLTKRIATAKKEFLTNVSSTVRGDSFGDGMPRGQSNVKAEEEKHMRRLELEGEIIPYLEAKLEAVEHKINLLDIDFDNNIKDQINDFIDLIPNDRYKDVMKQFYIYRKTYRAIANDTFIAEETAKDYRKRGFKSLVNILYNYTKNTHLE